MIKRLVPLAVALATLVPGVLHAELKTAAIFGDHMVLQQKQTNPVWGWDTPGTKVKVTFAGKTEEATAGQDGRWEVKLAPQPANAQPQTLTLAGTTTKNIQDVLVGEVWICSGQSNMQWSLNREYNGDIEAKASKLPHLRLIKVPSVGTQERQNDFKGEWKLSDEASANSFSAVGFIFGRFLHEILGVPVGLIDNAWGGSAAEAWVKRDVLEADPRFAKLTKDTKDREAYNTSPKAKTDYEAAQAKYKQDAEAAKAAGKPTPRPPQGPDGWLKGNARIGNIYNGVLAPTIGYGIKGAVWYQGETNAGRAKEYRDLFPFMIEHWRKEWKQGEFPFYWVQLADFKAEQANPGDSDWAELREAQTLTQKLPNTGQAVIIDLGEQQDIHPRDKYRVAARLVRWALAKDYGVKVFYHSPEFKSAKFEGNKAVVTLDTFGSKLKGFDVPEIKGFAVCGEDKVWKWATGTIKGADTVEVVSKDVAKPVAVRYAWADNPVCNLSTEDGLPATPFRSDDFPMITAGK